VTEIWHEPLTKLSRPYFSLGASCAYQIRG